MCSVVKLCLTLCYPIDYSPADSSVHGGVPRQEYWSVLAFASPGDLPNLGIKPVSLTLQADSLLSESPGKPHDKEMDVTYLIGRVYRSREETVSYSGKEVPSGKTEAFCAKVKK